MADIDLKALTPGSAAASSVIVGAANTSAATPSLFTTTGSGNVVLTDGTLAVTTAKTFTVNNTLTLAGTDGTTMTFPSTSATLARTDAGNTFTSNQTFTGSIVLNGATSGTVTLGVPATAGTTTFTLPSSNGTNGFILTTNGSGVTSWTNPTSLGIDLDIGTTALTSGTVGRVLFEGAGNVLQESANLTFSSSALTLGVAGSATGSVVLAGATSGTVTLQPAAAAGTGTIFQFPSSNGTANYALTTNGSGVSSWSQISLTAGVTGVLPVANGGTGVTTSTGTGSVVLSNSPTLVTPSLGTPSSGNLANCTFPTLNQNTTGTASNITGTLAVAQGGTGATATTGTGSNVLATSPTLVTPVLGTPTSVTLTNATGLPLTTGVTGTLPVANGGTGVTTSTGSGANVLGTTPTFTTSALFPAGTLSAPGISVSGDTNTGIYFPAADTIGFVEGGVEAMRIDSSGNVGIGTSNPAVRMHLKAPASSLVNFAFENTNGGTDAKIVDFLNNGNDFVFRLVNDAYNAANAVYSFTRSGTSVSNHSWYVGAAAEAMRIDSSGNLLVGTSTSGTLLTVNGVATLCSGTATPAAGSTSARLLFGTTAGFGIYYGSGAPTVSAAQGSIYLRSDGSSTSTRLYVNSSSGSGTTWTNVTTAA